jgi:hypothetical protein
MDQQHVDTNYPATRLRQVGNLALPYSFDVRLKYCDVTSLSTVGSVGTINGKSFRLNSLYDPDYSGAGHQPYQYDQLTAIYGHYIVKSATVNVRFRNVAGHTYLWAGANIITDNDSASGSFVGKTVSAAREFGNSWLRPLGSFDDRVCTFSYNMNVDMAQQFGLGRAAFDAQRSLYGASVLSNPSQSVYLQLGVCDLDADTTKSIQADIEIVYHATMYDYRSVAQS